MDEETSRRLGGERRGLARALAGKEELGARGLARQADRRDLVLDELSEIPIKLPLLLRGRGHGGE